MQGHTLGRRHFGQDVVAVEFNAVIARLGHFVGMRKGRGIRKVLQCVDLGVDNLRTYGRHHKHITVISTPGATYMCMRKAVDKCICIIISRTCIPSVYAGVG